MLCLYLRRAPRERLAITNWYCDSEGQDLPTFSKAGTDQGFSVGNHVSHIYFEETTKIIDEDRELHIVNVDFSKAFDEVPHCRLVWKVRSHAMQGKLENWTQNWLLGKVRMVVEACYSDWMPLTSSEAKGLMLDLLLY